MAVCSGRHCRRLGPAGRPAGAVRQLGWYRVPSSIECCWVSAGWAMNARSRFARQRVGEAFPLNYYPPWAPTSAPAPAPAAAPASTERKKARASSAAHAHPSIRSQAAPPRPHAVVAGKACGLPEGHGPPSGCLLADSAPRAPLSPPSRVSLRPVLLAAGCWCCWRPPRPAVHRR
eukprot:COSAG04_NODE_348_length_16121_cov_7.375172_17_plen_175_part_00